MSRCNNNPSVLIACEPAAWQPHGHRITASTCKDHAQRAFSPAQCLHGFILYSSGQQHMRCLPGQMHLVGRLAPHLLRLASCQDEPAAPQQIDAVGGSHAGDGGLLLVHLVCQGATAQLGAHRPCSRCSQGHPALHHCSGRHHRCRRGTAQASRQTPQL